MLRVGLTGGLGSGKSTAAAMFQKHGAHVLSADDLGRELMEPGTDVFSGIVKTFGLEVLTVGGRLDRTKLAHLAFEDGRVEELNAIVHPATIARQGELAGEIARQNPGAIVMVESALIFETNYGDGWRGRFDRMVLVAAPEALKVERFVSRSSHAAGGDAEALAAEARLRLKRMIPDEAKAGQCEFVLVNDGSLAKLQEQVDEVWGELTRAAP